MARIEHRKTGAAEALLTLAYERDAAGTIEGVVETRVQDAGTSIARWSYAYDEPGRLTEAVRAYGDGTTTATTTWRYAYDGAGNRTRRTVIAGGGAAVTDYRYNALDQLVARGDGATTTSYEYDAWGNLARTIEDDGGSTSVQARYTWNDSNHLLAVYVADGDAGTTISYGYDDRGARVGRSSSDAADPPLRYLTDAYNPTGYSQVLAEIDGASAEARRDYLYGESMLAQAEAALGGGAPGEPEWFVGDHLGSIRGLTGAGGSAIVGSAYDYSPYGLPLGAAGGAVPGAASSLTSYGYTGQWREALTGLQYHRARWLDPGAGRWLSVDPVFDFPGNFGHPYAYVGMNPVGWSDPSGKFALIAQVVMVAILLILVAIACDNSAKRPGTDTVEVVYFSSEAIKNLKSLTPAEVANVKSLTPLNRNSSGNIYLFEGENEGGWPIKVETWVDWGIDEARNEISQLYPNANIITIRAGLERQLISALNDPDAVGIIFFGHGGGWAQYSHGHLLCTDNGVYAGDTRINSHLQFFITLACSSGRSDQRAGKNWQEATHSSFFYGYRNPVLTTIMKTRVSRAIQMLEWEIKQHEK